MKVRRTVGRLLGERFFEPGVPIYVNRAVESFELIEHTHDFVELTYVSEGSGVHYINGEAVPVAQGDVFFLPVGVSHVFRPNAPKPDRTLVVYNCLFPPGFIAHLQEIFSDTAGIIASFTAAPSSWLQIRDPGEFHPLFKELYREFAAKQPGYYSLLTALVIRIIVGLHRHLQMGSLTMSGGSGGELTWHPIDEAIAYMDANYVSPMTLKRLAAEAKLSERQFSRLFLKRTGMNYSTYLQNLRIDAACRMLKSTRESVQNIASAVGYADMKFFHRLFRKKTGVTPRVYRTQS